MAVHKMQLVYHGSWGLELQTLLYWLLTIKYDKIGNLIHAICILLYHHMVVLGSLQCQVYPLIFKDN